VSAVVAARISATAGPRGSGNRLPCDDGHVGEVGGLRVGCPYAGPSGNPGALALARCRVRARQARSAPSPSALTAASSRCLAPRPPARGCHVSRHRRELAQSSATAGYLRGIPGRPGRGGHHAGIQPDHPEPPGPPPATSGPAASAACRGTSGQAVVTGSRCGSRSSRA
jgi:hypothetical protein